MSSSPYILSGPVEECDIPDESMGKYLFECLQNRDPDDIVNIDAVTQEILTCGKLLKETIQLCKFFKKLEIEEGDVICIVSENNIHLCVPVLSALLMGIIVNPLNPAYTIGELKHGLLISKPKLIFCSETALPTLKNVQKELHFIKTIAVIGSRYEDYCNVQNNLINIELEDIKYHDVKNNYSERGAFIFLSSGTTGLPKGVLITHQNLRESISLFRNSLYWNITSKCTTLFVLPLFHIYGMLIQMAAIVASMKLVLMAKFEPNVFLKSIQQYQVTNLYLVPPLLLFLVKSPLVDNYDISSLKDILVSAAPVGRALLDEATKRLGKVKIRLGYGLTEMSGFCTFQRNDSSEYESVGHLVPRLIAKVCNPNTQEIVGPSQIGELCFKGPTVMNGYVGNIAATQDNFDKYGFYHTGDEGFYDKNGYFYLVCRIKEIIKYKGFQVPPAELEALILTHPAVRDTGVIGIPNERAGQLTQAFVVRKNGSKVTEQEIVDFVAERISIQKRLYGGVKFIDEIPRNPSGKILRTRLLEDF